MLALNQIGGDILLLTVFFFQTWIILNIGKSPHELKLKHFIKEKNTARVNGIKLPLALIFPINIYWMKINSIGQKDGWFRFKLAKENANLKFDQFECTTIFVYKKLKSQSPIPKFQFYRHRATTIHKSYSKSKYNSSDWGLKRAFIWVALLYLLNEKNTLEIIRNMIWNFRSCWFFFALSTFLQFWFR